jgi:hypothetical protein
MQHPLTTFPRTAITPKKSADARLFCFTRLRARSRLQSAYKIWVAVGYRQSLGGVGTGLFFEM